MRYFAFILALIFPNSAFAQMSVPADGIVNAPGSYILTSNRSNKGGTHAILISANNVDLNLNGKIVECSPPSPSDRLTYGIIANNSANVTIRNGRTRGCVVGVSVSGTSNAAVDGIDFSNTRHVGITGSDEITGFRATNNIFANFAGFPSEASAMGINRAGLGCSIERNVFRNLHRQVGARSGMAGEGVGLIQSPASTGCVVRNNWFENDSAGTHLEVGIWVGTSAMTVSENSFTNIGRGLAAAPGYNLRAIDNRFWMREPQTGSYAVGAQDGLASGNVIIGYDTPIQGNIPTQDNLILR